MSATSLTRWWQTKLYTRLSCLFGKHAACRGCWCDCHWRIPGTASPETRTTP